MNSKLSAFGFVLMLVASVFATVGVSEASVGSPIGLVMNEVKVNGNVITDSEILRTELQRDNTLEVTVRFQTIIPSNSSNATGSAQDVEVTASLSGYEYNDNSDERVSSTTEPFDVEPGVVYTKKLTLKLPDNLDRDDYKLRILVADRNSMLEVFNYNLIINTEKHDIVIKDITLTPDDEVQAGRALLAVVRVKNMGQNDESDVKVKISIPDLAITQTDFLDTLDADESKSSEDLYLRIPKTAKAGTYDLIVTVSYDNDHGKITKTVPVHIVADKTYSPVEDQGEDQQGTVGGKTVVTVGPSSQAVTGGEGGAIYKLTLANQGSTSKQYVVEVNGASDWATVKINPGSVVMLEPGATKDVFVYVAAGERASAGSHPFNVVLKSGNSVVQEIPLNADVVSAASSSGSDRLKKGLEVGTIVLVVLLVIVTIIIAVTRVSKKDEEMPAEPSEPIAQTYY